jgi:acetyl esterase/lipase
MKNFVSLLGALLFCISISQLNAQTITLPVWTGSIPGALNSQTVREDTITLENGQKRVRRVTNPTVAVFLPAKPNNGAAIIICPGGGYERLAYDHEGMDIAKKLNEYGIAGIVLKYRLPNDTIMDKKENGPLADAQEAMRVVRRHAKEWNLNPDKIGIAGFSAGGHLASTLSTQFNKPVYQADSISARPSFAILVYPVITMKTPLTHAGSRKRLLGNNPSDEICQLFSNEMQVTTDTPPTFIVHAADDPSVPVQNSIQYFEALNRYKVPAELHVYQKGGHGFGLARDKGTTAQWFDSCIRWLHESGIIN